MSAAASPTRPRGAAQQRCCCCCWKTCKRCCWLCRTCKSGCQCKMSCGTFLRLVGLTVLLALIITVGACFGSRAADFIKAMEKAGGMGALLYCVVYIFCTICTIPEFIMAMGAGYLYGVIGGFLVTQISITSAAACSLLIGRYLLRSWVEALLMRYPKFVAVNRAIETQGFKVVLLLTLSPIMINSILNYLLSVTSIRFRDFVCAISIGIIPGNFLYVFLGHVASDVSVISSGEHAFTYDIGIKAGIVGASLVLTGLAVLLITVQARRILNNTLMQTSERRVDSSDDMELAVAGVMGSIGVQKCVESNGVADLLSGKHEDDNSPRTAYEHHTPDQKVEVTYSLPGLPTR